MQKIPTSRLKKILTKVMARVPRRLPETAAAYEKWEVEILAVGKFPQNDSFRHAIATQVLHLSPGVHFKSQMYFVNNLRRSITNQTAFQVIQDTKPGRKDETEKAVD